MGLKSKIIFLVLLTSASSLFANLPVGLEAMLDDFVGITEIHNCKVEVWETTIAQNGTYDRAGLGIMVTDNRIKKIASIYLNNESISINQNMDQRSYSFKRVFTVASQKYHQYLKIHFNQWNALTLFEVGEFNETKLEYTQRSICKQEHLGGHN
ncbi:MAG: hypothetical protein HOO06_11825 [Bdellovibrionaceae bacterium]|jgi:hypothetical protein|nr:hypothetical protein [Pseudobdellovibrionaceae bacterium]